MALEQFVSDYGAFGLFAGAGLEGETVAMLGGVLAHRGLLDFWTAVLAVAAGSFLTGQIFFLAGRRFRKSPWAANFKPGLRERASSRRSIVVETSSCSASVSSTGYAWQAP